MRAGCALLDMHGVHTKVELFFDNYSENPRSIAWLIWQMKENINIYNIM